jgi:hypothetical protein
MADGKLTILPLQSQYIYSLLLFVSNNRQHFKINSDVHNINTRNNLDFHYPFVSLPEGCTLYWDQVI